MLTPHLSLSPSTLAELRRAHNCVCFTTDSLTSSRNGFHSACANQWNQIFLWRLKTQLILVQAQAASPQLCYSLAPSMSSVTDLLRAQDWSLVFPPFSPNRLDSVRLRIHLLCLYTLHFNLYGSHQLPRFADLSLYCSEEIYLFFKL